MKLPKALNEATAGAALKYHLKRALERSHSISEFSKNLELSAQNAKFSNNTLKIIEELTNGVKKASEEIKEKATKYEKALQELQKIDESKLTKEQQQVLKVFKGELDQAEIKGIDLNDLYILDQGTRHVTTKKILVKHYGVENTGGPTNDELINMSEVIKNGSVLLESFERLKNGFRYGYEWDNNGVKLRLVVDDLNNGNKIFDFYSDRNFKDFRDARPQPSTSKDNGTQPITLNENNPTQKPLTSQEDLLKNTELNNQTTPEVKNLSPLEQANAEKLLKLQHAITPLKEFGKNYPEFALKPKEALEKLLQEKNGQVAGAAFREDLGGIDFVWGNKDYGLEHILKRREEQAISKGLSEAEAKEYALNVVKSIPEIIEKGVKVDNNGRIVIEYQNIRVALKDNWKGEKLPNHWVITSYERMSENSGSLYSSPLITKRSHLLLNSNEPNPTQKPLTDQEDLLKNTELESETTQEATNLSPLEQANAEKLLKLQHAITPLKEFGKNYPEFALKPKEALEKLLQEKNGQVAGAAFREDLGGIDFVWGNKDYGLEHILEKRKKQYKRLGLTNEQAKERTNELIKEIPNIIQKGLKEEDKPGYAVIILNNSKVVLSKFKGDNELKNHYMITSFEADDKVLRELETIATLSNDYRDGINYSTSNLNEPNPTTNALKKQDLSPLEQANAEKLAKLQREQEQSEQEFLKAKEQEAKRKEALKKKLEHERGNAGNIESQTKIEVGEDIPTQIQAQIPKSRVRLNEREIYDLDYAIVKAKDLKPSFTTGGTQKRTDMNEEQIKSIAENFDPKKIFGSGGFEDLPIILHDGQVIAGNHRIAGMLNFTPKSRFAYERAIKEYYHIDLKPDELLVRVPHNRLNNTEINNLAASSNQGRFNSESDHAIAVLSHYEAKLKELDQKLNADSVYSLKDMVAKNLNFDKATHPNVGDSNLALLMYNMPRTKTQGIELLNRWQKAFSNDIKSYEKVKKMFVDNAGSFHNLIHDMNFPNVSLNAYLSDIMDRSFANLKNYQSTSESLKDLSEKFYKTSSLDMFEKSDQGISDISEILGGAIARFARFDDPSKALFEALRSDNIKKGLKEFKIADITKDMFDPKSKEFKDIDIYDFTHYLLMVNREPNENNPVLNRLVQAVKDMQKESEKGIKEVSKKTAEETERGIKERAFKVIEDKEAFLKDLNAIKPMPLPKEIDTGSFLNAFNGVKNKENFIKHLKSKPDSAYRLAYLHLVEPTLKEPDITLIFKEQGKEFKKEHIKAFQGDPKTIYYFLVTQDNDNKLITGLRTSENYLKTEIDKADIIHSFIPQDS
ncbi:DUF3519 domain-containing protein [Helicobacter pylori]|uniref:DUF3519 domain-containing protein n=2 Tax=Helicobacter pylori TaxID=210 RepID=UPI001E3B23BE|nr:DUF3519 domain-containing protein [Helicobacter pylori]